MKKWISFFLISSLFSTQCLVAEDEVGATVINAASQEDQTPTSEAAEPPPQEVDIPPGHAAVEGASQSTNTTWRNVAIATGAIAVATIAILVISYHEGHRVHH